MNILEEIIAEKRLEVIRRKRDVRASDLRDQVHFHRAALALRSSLVAAPHFGIIAEFKRFSPSSGGLLAGKADAAETALAYQASGAAGISVLTDAPFFHGSLDDLRRVRDAVALPVLRKDFIIDPYQILEAKAYGADAVLLIAAVLEKTELAELFAAAGESGLECLVELYDEKEIDILETERMQLIGINNRDLTTFSIRKDHAIGLARLLPPEVTVVSESGIRAPEDLRHLRANGIAAALVGEYCMRADSPGDALRALLEGAAK